MPNKVKKSQIIRLLFKSRKGLLQTKRYNKKAKEFWKVKESQMIDELIELLAEKNANLLRMNRGFVRRIGFPELSCSLGEIEELRKIINIFGEDLVISDLVKYMTRTGFLTMVIAPGLAAAEGMGDVHRRDLEEWLYGIAICLPVCADVCDLVLDEEVLKHSLIPYSSWLIAHKMGATLLFYISLKHIDEIKHCGKNIKRRIIKRLNDGLNRVCEKQKLDMRAKENPKISFRAIESIYEGKICEIEATVFGTIPSKKIDLVQTFEEGAKNFAGEMQIVDDIEDLLGDENLGKEPEIPNPSFFLAYCIDAWNKGERDLEEIMKVAAERTLERGERYHQKVLEAFDGLPKKFPTKPFFNVTLWYFNQVLKDKVKKFLKGDTFEVLKPKLEEILKNL